MKNNASFLYGLFLLVCDTAALILAFVGAYIIRVTYGTAPIAQPVAARTYFLILLALLPLWLVLFALFGLYNRSVYEKRFSEIGRLFVGTIVGTLFIVGIAYFSNDPIFPAKLVPVYGFILTFVLLVVFRSLARVVRRILFAYNKGISNVLIVGNTSTTKELVAWLNKPTLSGYRVVGIVGKNKGVVTGIPSYATFEDAMKALSKKGVHSIMQTELFTDADRNDEVLSYAQNHHIAFRFVPGSSELFVGNIDVELFQSSIPMVAVHQTALIGWGRIIKRLFDLVVSAVAVVLLSPVFLLVAIAQLLFGGKGGVFFKQTRLTRYNREFTTYKFRTLRQEYNGMTPEAGFTKMGKPELGQEFRENGDFLHNDPRLTKLGRFLRATSLDELPQLINVLKGDISLVGPRALVPQELNAYEKRHAILSVKSGLTGLAQVSGRKNISFDERRKLDIYYVQNWTFWMDIVILLKTVRVIFGGN